MKTKTPNLTEMGVLNPEQIVGYTTIHVTEDMDVLKIDYRRKPNSFLPKRRKYEFKRTGKPMAGGGLKGEQVVRYDISPILSRAIAELDLILADSKRAVASKKDLQRELADLSAEMNERIKHLSQTIDALK